MAVEGAQRGQPARDRGRGQPARAQLGEVALEVVGRGPAQRFREHLGGVRRGRAGRPRPFAASGARRAGRGSPRLPVPWDLFYSPRTDGLFLSGRNLVLIEVGTGDGVVRMDQREQRPCRSRSVRVRPRRQGGQFRQDRVVRRGGGRAGAQIVAIAGVLHHRLLVPAQADAEATGRRWPSRCRTARRRSVYWRCAERYGMTIGAGLVERGRGGRLLQRLRRGDARRRLAAAPQDPRLRARGHQPRRRVHGVRHAARRPRGRADLLRQQHRSRTPASRR